MAKNVKTSTVETGPPLSGWAPHNSRARLLSQLDAATGRLTGDQQRYYADLPSEEFSVQPSTGHKIISTPDGATEYHQLVAHGATWHDPATGAIVTNVAVRP
jgi:hypothetical protein